jgi:hypothetical protein
MSASIASLMASAVLRWERAWPMVSWMLTGIGLVYVVAAVLGLAGIGGCSGPIVPCDAAAYFYTEHGPYSWAAAPAGVPPYRYAPVFLWLVAPLTAWGFTFFVIVWLALHVGALVWLRAGWMLAIPAVNEDVIRGNINTFVAVLLVLAVRHSLAWTPVLLTKVVPGIGLLWHVARREWRAVGAALAATLAVVLLGAAVEPRLWASWFAALQSSPSNYAGIDNVLPITVRLPVAAIVVWVAGASSRAWLLPIGVLVAWPGILPPAFMVLAAIPRLRHEALQETG